MQNNNSRAVYVYKYIKNIRAKIDANDALKNADKGGFIFNM